MSDAKIAVIGSVVTAVIAIIAPIISSIILKITENKKLKIDNIFLCKQKAYENLMEVYAAFSIEQNEVNIREFSIALNKSLLYCSEDIRNIIIGNIELINNKNYQGAILYFQINLLQLLSIDLNISKGYITNDKKEFKLTKKRKHK